MKSTLILAATLLLTLAGNVLASPLQDGYQATYRVSHNGMQLGESRRALRPLEDGSLRLEARTHPTGLAALLLGDTIDEYSQLRIDGGAIQPLSYHYHRHGGRKEQQYELAFDGASGQLRFIHDGNRTVEAPASLDPLSFQVAVMQRLGQQEKDFVLPIAGRRGVDDYRFSTANETEMDTPLGRLKVVHLQARQQDRNSWYELWCAPALDYLPVRISHHDDGDTTNLSLSRYTELQHRS